MGYFHLSFQRTPPWVPSKLVYHQEYCFLIWSSVSVLLFLPFVSYIRLEQAISKSTAWFQGWNPSFMQNPRAQRSTLYSHYPLSWFYSECSIQIFGRRTAKAVVEPGEKKDNCHCDQLGLFCFKTRLIFTLSEGCGILLVLFERPITKDAWRLDFM